MTVHIQGDEALRAKFGQIRADMLGSAFAGAMRNAMLLITASAKQNAPVDTGRLRASITPDVTVSGATIKGVTGSNVVYAPFQELGTGTFAGNAPHFPPPSALEVWARRHGFPSGYVVARAIWRRGGLRPLRYLGRALDQNKGRVFGMLADAFGRIITR